MHLNKRNSGVADLSRAGKRTRKEERPGGSTRESAEKRRQLYKTVVLFRVRREKILKIQKKEVFHMSGSCCWRGAVVGARALSTKMVRDESWPGIG